MAAKPEAAPAALRIEYEAVADALRELPDATLHVSDSSGHDVGADRTGEIMSVLASHMKQRAASDGE
jgi:FMN phosphatase YigB (HAD superfamily)